MRRLSRLSRYPTRSRSPRQRQHRRTHRKAPMIAFSACRSFGIPARAERTQRRLPPGARAARLRIASRPTPKSSIAILQPSPFILAANSIGGQGHDGRGFGDFDHQTLGDVGPDFQEGLHRRIHQLSHTALCAGMFAPSRTFGSASSRWMTASTTKLSRMRVSPRRSTASMSRPIPHATALPDFLRNRHSL